MIREAISKLVDKKSLQFEEAKEAFEQIFTHKATAVQIASFLTALKIKGETEAEILAAATVIREKANKVNVRDSFVGIEDKDEPVMDTCGTGGSGLNKFNISTAVSFVISAAGIKVAKHGNRAMSSSCGSADVLEALDVDIGVSPEIMQESIKRVGIGFLYAPLYHPALAEVAKVRKELGIRTIFNILGPLCNPASASHQLLGVYSRSLTHLMAKVLRSLGVKKAFVVNSKDLCDEISLSGPTHVSFLNNKKISNLTLKPSNFGLKKIKIKNLLVKDVKMRAKIIKDILNKKHSDARDIVLANAGACFYMLGKAKNLKQGVKLAAGLIDEGKAKDVYLKFKAFLEENA